VAGYNWTQLAGTDVKVINFVQLVVVDTEADPGERVVWVDEHRRKNSDDTELVEFSVSNITPNREYAFLLLMGQWQRDWVGEADEPGGSSYKYSNISPTLLKSGFIEQQITSGDNSITLNMRRPKVDTSFVASSPVETREPGTLPVGSGKNQLITFLSPRDWTIKWTLQWGDGTNALEKLLLAEKVFYPTASSVSVRSVSGYAGGETSATVSPDADIHFDGINTVTMKIANSTQVANIGNKYSANFRLEYLPFNLTASAEWTDRLTPLIWQNVGAGVPVWSIRNGVNNNAQNPDTNFANYTVAGFTNSANGNGAVVFAVRAESANEGIDPPAFLTIAADGKITEDTMKFTPGGWTGSAPDVYYWFGDTKPTDYSFYKKVTPTSPLMKDSENMISKTTIGGDNWVADSGAWVVLLKDGKFGEPAKLVLSTTIDVGSGNIGTGDEEPGVDDAAGNPKPIEDAGTGSASLGVIY
jgi:hypothetical protein